MRRPRRHSTNPGIRLLVGACKEVARTDGFQELDPLVGPEQPLVAVGPNRDFRGEVPEQLHHYGLVEVPLAIWVAPRVLAPGFEVAILR